MRELLLPRPDAGVLVQLGLFCFVAAAALFAVRRRHEWLVFVTGLALVGLGLFGVRALH